METLTTGLRLKQVFKSVEVKPTIILLGSLTLVVLHRCFGMPEVASHFFPSISSFGAALYTFVTAFVLLGLIPLLLIVSVFKESLRDYGLRIGDWKFGLIFIAIVFPLYAIAFLYPASFSSAVRAAYPINRDAGRSVFAFIEYELTSVVLIITAWEFCFRGFMLFGLRGRVGAWLSICIQTIPQCLWHIGLPAGIPLSAIVTGVLLGILAIRTQSILWTILLHFLIWTGLDFFIVYA